MGQLNMILNQPQAFDPTVDFLDSGWVLTGGYAIHFPCNPGYLNYAGNFAQLGLILGDQYDINYLLDQYNSGNVYPILGGNSGTPRTANGTYTDTITWDGTNNLQFYSNGALRISELSIANHLQNPDNGQTIVWSEKLKQWRGYYSFEPEFMLRYGEKFFTFKGGALWLNNSNTLYNNFFGVQYGSVITFFINIDNQIVKNFFNIRQIASEAWGSANMGDIFILPYQGKPNGQQSRLKVGNYRNLQGDFFSDFLRDMSDPRFYSQLTALFEGAELQGHVLQITLENTSANLVRLVSVDVSTSPQQLTYAVNNS